MTRSPISALLPIAALAAFSLPITTAGAQHGPWSSLPASGATLQNEQSLVVVTLGNTVFAFSAFTKNWAAVTGVYGPLSRTLLNEHLIVRDGSVFHGYSPRTGGFTALAASAGATLATNSNAQTFSSAVIDGNRVHVFFAFTGQWQTYTFPSAPSVTMGRFCLLIGAAGTTYAISDFYGTLVPAPAGATPLRADGNMAFATAAGQLHGFGAGSNSWSTLNVAATPTIAIGNTQPTCASIRDGVTTAMFSGHTGTFATLPVSPSATVTLERELGIAVDGSLVVGYSGLLGTQAVLPMAAPPVVTMQQMFALVDDGTGVTAYSGTTGTFATPYVDPAAAIQTRAQIAVAFVGSNPVAAYSSMRNRWDPVAVAPGSAAYMNAVALVTVDPAGTVTGWSQRGSGFVTATTGPVDAVTVGTNPPNTPETIWLRAGNTMWTFNPRTEAWRSVTTAAPASLIRAHYQVILAQDGTNAYGFDIWNDAWSVEPLIGGYVGGSGQVQSGYVNDGTVIHAYGGFGALAMLGEFPDFYRAATAGMPLRHDVLADPGTFVVLLASVAPAYAVLPFGTLLIDPNVMATLMIATAPPSGVLTHTMFVPSGATGTEWFFQALVLGGPSGLYLTNSTFPLLL